MADRRTRELQRRAAAGDYSARLGLAAIYLRRGDSLKVIPLLHSTVKHYPEARSLFLQALPEDSHAFCGLCGKAFVMGPRGYPMSDRPRSKKIRMAKTKRYCHACGLQRQVVGRNIATRARQPWIQGPVPKQLEDAFCGVCGAVTPDASHRCDKTLPDWVTGGSDHVDPFYRPPSGEKPHWTE